MKSHALIVMLALSPYAFLACKNANESLEDLEALFSGITVTDVNGNLVGNFDAEDWIHPTIFFGNKIDITPSPRIADASFRYVPPSHIYFPAQQIGEPVSKFVRFANFTGSEQGLSFSPPSEPFAIGSTSLSLSPTQADSVSIQVMVLDTNTTVVDTLNIMNDQGEVTQMLLIGFFEDPQKPLSVFPPVKFAFGPAFPNPASTSTDLRFALPIDNELVSITVLGQDGETVRSLADGVHGHGLFSLTWDLRGDNNAKLDPGIYRMVFESDHFMSHGDIEIR